jgi:serine/threonine protein kinase/class 3 adenylate cyclase
MAELKTIVFTDIVRSVDLKNEMPGQSDTERDVAFIEQILTPHRQRIEQNLAVLGGRVVSTAGDGHFLVFSDTVSAARWAIGIQRSHRDEPIRTPKGRPVAVRISMHLGIPQIDPHDANNFIGKPVDYAARLSDYATGDQILVSRSVVAVLEDAGMDGVRFHNHGRHELKGIGRVEAYELLFDGMGPHAPRTRPRDSYPRQWTVLPATMGLTDFRDRPEHERAKQPSSQGRPTTDVVPARLGNYELEERLGSGGMGDVFRARHAQFNRVRAVKVIKQQFVDAGHDEIIRRFYQEIKAVGALEHPNIVVAIDSSAPTDDVHYLVMEYIEGVAADELVSDIGPMPVADACEIARQAARGLAYIHKHGMVHRDIKPSNLMLTLAPSESVSSGSGVAQTASGNVAVVKILDLGLALLVGDDQQRLTVFDNRAMGTAMYMSPEQWKSTSVDIRADIYSLGCALYHLLAGKPPFLDSDLKPEKAHEREHLPPIGKEPPVPRALWDILRRMTAKNPADRYADPAEVAAALAPFAQQNHLAEVVQRSIVPPQDAPTRRNARSDTRLAKSADSDTIAGSKGNWRLRGQLSDISKRRLNRAAVSILALAIVAGIGWLAIQATGRRESVAEALAAREHTLQVGARFAASEVLKEIDLRFDILSQAAADDELRQRLAEVDSRPARKSDNDDKASSESWFIDDVRGVQIARSPRSETSSGENFAHRDYFHGQGLDLPPDTKDQPPLKSPHLSTVYRSTSTGHLKVAFSVPITRKGKAREVIGVLAMAVDLGEFDVLKKDLPPGQEVVLIDLRQARINKETRRGLILHRQRETSYREGHPAPWVGENVMNQIDKLLSNADAEGLDNGAILKGYKDDVLTDGQTFWGAIQPVIGSREDEPTRNIHWVVLVQEPLKR